MTEGRAILLAGGAHLALFVGLSLTWAMQKDASVPMAEAVPVEVVDISDIARITEPPKPSMDAAPQETVEAAAPDPAPEERTSAEAAPAERDPAPSPDPMPAEKPQPQPQRAKPRATSTDSASAARQRANQRLDAQELANLIDKSLPKARTRTRDPSEFAKSIEQALPRSARIDARATAQLQQAIYAQLKPCWNPPLGGEGASSLTVVLNVKYSRDGTVVGRPEVLEVTGSGNATYVETFKQAAVRTVLNPRCSPLKLPAELYDAWREIELGISASMMT